MDQKIFKQKVIPIFTLSLIITAISCALGVFFLSEVLKNFWVFIGLALASLVLVFVLYSKKSLPLLLIFNILEGLILVPLINLAIAVDPILIAEALGITVVVFLALAGYVYFSKKDFTFMGGALFVLLILGLLVSLAGFFLNISWLALGLSAFFTLLFAGFVLYDMSAIMKNYSDNDYIPAVVSLYIDFINLFVNILMLLINLRGDNN